MATANIETETSDFTLDFPLLCEDDIKFELSLRGRGPPWDNRDLKAELNKYWEYPQRMIVHLNNSMHDLITRAAEFEFNLMDSKPSQSSAIKILYIYLQHRCKYVADAGDPDKAKSRRVLKMIDRHMEEYENREQLNASGSDTLAVELPRGRGRGAIPKYASHLNVPFLVNGGRCSPNLQTNLNPQNTEQTAEIPPGNNQVDTVFSVRVTPASFKDWSISFSGARGSKKVRSFILELERMSAAQGVPLHVVNRAVRLFLTGDALLWYNTCWQYLPTWESFSMAIRSAFMDVESDFSIRKRIEERKQRPGEPVEVFLAAMQELFDELEDGISENEKIRLTRRNLLFAFSNPLALTQVQSMVHLGSLLKQIELNRLFTPPNPQKSGFSNPSQQRQVNEVSSPRNFVQNNQQRPNTNNRRDNGQVPREDNQITCVNCGVPGHKAKDCPQPRKCNIMCYKCGLENTITSRCPVCKPKGEERAARQ